MSPPPQRMPHKKAGASTTSNAARRASVSPPPLRKQHPEAGTFKTNNIIRPTSLSPPPQKMQYSEATGASKTSIVAGDSSAQFPLLQQEQPGEAGPSNTASLASPSPLQEDHKEHKEPATPWLVALASTPQNRTNGLWGPGPLLLGTCPTAEIEAFREALVHPACKFHSLLPKDTEVCVHPLGILSILVLRLYQTRFVESFVATRRRDFPTGCRARRVEARSRRQVLDALPRRLEQVAGSFSQYGQ
jgi:hypothetical protein